MARGSGIEWTEATWNPVTGCTKVSPGCKHCYAERMALRLRAMGVAQYAAGFQVAAHDRLLSLPLTWPRPQLVFVNSMSDLFHGSVEEDFIRRAFEVMEQADWHRFQVLTKRSRRLRQLAGKLPWPDHVWMEVSVETSAYLDRVEDLRAVPARVKFLSLEPLLGPVEPLELSGIDWVIVGGESGPRARPMDPAWVHAIWDRCAAAGVPFFFKQWGGPQKKRAGRLLEGRTWDEMPRAVAR